MESKIINERGKMALTGSHSISSYVLLKMDFFWI